MKQKSYITKRDAYIFINADKELKIGAYHQMIINLESKRIITVPNSETKIRQWDLKAEPINIEDYFKIAILIKMYSKYWYNKKIGKLMSKIDDKNPQKSIPF